MKTIEEIPCNLTIGKTQHTHTHTHTTTASKSGVVSDKKGASLEVRGPHGKILRPDWASVLCTAFASMRKSYRNCGPAVLRRRDRCALSGANCNWFDRVVGRYEGVQLFIVSTCMLARLTLRRWLQRTQDALSSQFRGLAHSTFMMRLS